MTDESAYQATAPIKSQEIAANEQLVKAKPAQLHEQAMQHAVKYLNKQAERGAHASHFDPASTEVP